MMKNDDNLPSLDKLQAKIDQVKKSGESESDNSSKTDMSQAVRFLTDLAAGVIMGVGVGYLIDKWSDKTPLFMIIGLFIGMAAGVKNMLRSAKLADKELTGQDDKKI